MTPPWRADALAGQVALVTGSASGIGRVTALEFAGAGAAVALVDVAREGLDETAAAARDAGVKTESFPADLSAIAAIPSLVDGILERLGRIDILVNIAGIAARATLLEGREEEWDRVHTINVKAPFFLTQAVARHMIDRGGGGKVVNVASSSAFRARAG